MAVVLAMIVRDEEHAVAATMASALPFVDSVLIADTGSTDDTIGEVVRTARAHNKPGRVLRVPFRNFAQARNAVMDTAEPGDVLVWLDAEDRLAGGRNLRALASHPGNCWVVKHAWSTGQRFTRSTIVRAGTGWRYVGRVHELLRHETETECEAWGINIYQQRTARNEARSCARQAWDVRMLRRQIAVEPDEVRWQRYLARTEAAIAARTKLS